jgi:SAM-dependent methyltransferase
MDNTHLLVEEIKAAENMASGYRRYVADFCGSAPSSATGFEKYEDLMLRKIIDQYVKNNKKLVFIEVGSGPGRYLLRYGAKISTNKDSCKKYRDHADLQRFYKYDKDYEENLQLIIGIDFSESMIKNAQEWLKENDLQNLVYNDRILQIIADIQNLNLSFKDTPYEHSYKVVACLFQTIGNQLNHQLRVNLVKKMMELVKPYGTILISAFHKDVFSEFIPKYYQKIIPSIGKITFIDKEKGTLKTKKGVFSHWFSPEEIKNILRDANINKNKITIKTGNDLPLFRKDVDYVSLGDQEDIRKRAIFAIIDV